MIPANILNLADPNYPNLLKQIHKPPQKLYYKGDPALLNKNCIAVVGTRRYSGYGEEMTGKIIEELSCLDICIVSGLALGIDTIAHRAALEYGLPTIAILGSGIDNIYPLENTELAAEIIKQGLIISEYPGLFSAIRTNFPQRNRIVSGLSIATIMIEAPEKSGALITADLALEHGREIFTVPGDIDRENSIGPLRLLQKGAAYAVSSGQEIIEILKEQPHLLKLTKEKYLTPRAKLQSESRHPKNDINYNFSPTQQKIISLLHKHRGLDLESLSNKANLPIRELLQSISVLEIQQLISTKGGKYYRNC